MLILGRENDMLVRWSFARFGSRAAGTSCTKILSFDRIKTFVVQTLLVLRYPMVVQRDGSSSLYQIVEISHLG